MEKEFFEIKITDITFPEESGLIIEKILEKYDFKKAQDEGIEKFFASRIPKERKEIFENLPGSQISNLVREYAEGKVSLENLPLLLKERLNIPREKAKKIAEELEKKLLILIRPAEEKKLPPRIPPIEVKQTVSPLEKPKPPQKPDIYQEPIE